MSKTNEGKVLCRLNKEPYGNKHPLVSPTEGYLTIKDISHHSCHSNGVKLGICRGRGVGAANGRLTIKLTNNRRKTFD